jgi:hypothetical protein
VAVSGVRGRGRESDPAFGGIAVRIGAGVAWRALASGVPAFLVMKASAAPARQVVRGGCVPLFGGRAAGESPERPPTSEVAVGKSLLAVSGPVRS